MSSIFRRVVDLDSLNRNLKWESHSIIGRFSETAIRWGSNPITDARVLLLRLDIGVPLTRTSPESTGYHPQRQRRRDDLPLPLQPTMTVNECGEMDRLQSLMTPFQDTLSASIRDGFTVDIWTVAL